MIPQFTIFHIIILIIISPISPPQAYAKQKDGIIAQNGCYSTCGEISIPFPFGMNESYCSADEYFEIECKSDKPYLKYLNLEVKKFDESSSLVQIMNPIYSSCPHKKTSSNNDKTVTINLRDTPFVYSQNGNTFLAVGCYKLAFLQSNGTKIGGCVSICDNDNKNNNFNIGIDGCNGRHCCKTLLPSHLSEFNVTLESLREDSRDVCSYALIASNYTEIETSNELKNIEYTPAWLEWEILNEMLINSTRLHSNCYDSNISSLSNQTTGRQCRCTWGYTGNPYISGGCTGLNDNNNNNRSKKWAIIGVSSSLGSIVLLIGLWFLHKYMKKRLIKKQKQKFFKRNGGLLLKQRMSTGEVNVDSTALFTLKDLKKATENFNKNRVLGKGGQGTVYKGMLVDGKIVAVKKFKVEGNVEEFINEFVVLSQINNRNVVKLLGCCLETEIPLLVYEFIPNGNLFEYLHDQNEDIPMTWDMRLRIATEIAGALFYLHSIASQPIYHRDIKSTMVQGTFGYLDPEYFHTSQFTEKSDVYSFGVVLAELLTGKKPISSVGSKEFQNLASYFIQCIEVNMLFDIVDKRVIEEGEKEHITAVANLAYRCLELNGRKRPTMKEVTLDLEGIRGLNKKLNAQQNHEEIELAGIEEYQHWDRFSTSNSFPIVDSQTYSKDSKVMHMIALE